MIRVGAEWLFVAAAQPGAGSALALLSREDWLLVFGGAIAWVIIAFVIVLWRNK